MSECHYYSEQWVNDLWSNFNIGPRKSLTIKPPNGLTQEQSLSYICGLIDGDGSVYIQKSKGISYYKIKIVGTHELMHWCKDITGLKSSIGKYSSITELNIFGTNAKKFYNMVEDLNLPLMERKLVVLK